MMRRKISILVTGIMIIGTVSACGSTQKNSAVLEEGTEQTQEMQETEDLPEQGEFAVFTSQTLAGDAIDQEILKQADLTMINIWGTFCGPCIREMPDLGELAEEYQDAGLQIIGIPVDVYDQKGMDKAVKIVEETKADYTHILMSEDLYTAYLSQVASVPETLFVDAEGRILKSIMGSKSKDEWIAVIDEQLAAVQEDS